MNRSIKSFFIFTTVLLGTVVFLFSNKLSSPVYANGIPDGAAMIPSNGFPPEQNKVNPEVKAMWEKRKVPRGGKDPAFYNPINGNNLIYDVYAGTTNQEKKRGFHKNINENFITFDGWAVIQGHHHHTQQNQATYIGLVNKNNSNDRLIFKTAMRANTSANSDIHDGALPKCPNNVYNRPVVSGLNGACNMDYQYTQFRAYINLTDIFAGENDGKEWELYIIKRVGNQIVYDRLILPFDTQSFAWKNGTITMRSGEDARSLTMVGTDVIKRSSIGGTGPSGNQRYFAPGSVYRSNDVNDSPSNKVSVWYRVNDNVNTTVGGRTYRATNTNRWSASTFWQFGGSIATLKYTIHETDIPIKHVDANDNDSLITEETIRKQKIGSSYTAKAKGDGILKDSNGNPYRVINNSSQTKNVSENTVFIFKYKAHAPVTINHIDEKTGEILSTETIERIVGENYNVSSKPEGHFKTKDGYSYIPTPLNQNYNEVIRDKTTITFKYKAKLPDPTEIKEMDKSTEASAKGYFSWELHKVNKNAKSRIDIKNNFEITGKHYATRNISYKTNSSGIFNENGSTPQHLFIANPNSIKDKNINYLFSYEFTNHYWEKYKCIDKQGSSCFEWQFESYSPAWEKVDKAEWTKVLKTDHKYSESFTFDKESSDKLPLTIGRISSINGELKSLITDKVYTETFTVDRKDTKLESQTWKEVIETVKYQSHLTNEIYIIDGDKYYFPNDIDNNLRSKYENKTAHKEYSKYAIPLKISEQKNNEIKFRTSDSFLLTKNAGFLFSLPSDEISINRINSLAKEEYESYTNNKYEDTVLTSLNDTSRYYLNIDLKGSQKPNVKYDDNVVLGKFGLNDVTFHLIQKLEFDNFLFGHVKDDPLFVGQRTSIIPNVSYQETITLNNDDLSRLRGISKNRKGVIHGFRATDDYDLKENIKRVVPQ